MKAITLYHPWAALVAVGAKKIETRSWRTHYRGPLAIHASAREMVGDSIGLGRGVIVETLRDFQYNTATTRGCVIAVCDLVDCVAVESVEFAPGSNEIWFGDYTIGRWAWQLANVRQIKPVRARGMLGFWECREVSL